MPQNIYVLYGFAEGPGHAGKLRARLRKQGYTLVDTFEAADIVLSHSGGLTELPGDLSGKRVILVTPPVVPRGQNLGLTMLQKVRTNPHLWAIALNFYYGLTQMRRNLRIRNYVLSRGHTLPRLEGGSVEILFSQSDSWSRGVAKLNQRTFPSYVFTEIPNGLHDDIWERPESVLRYL